MHRSRLISLLLAVLALVPAIAAAQTPKIDVLLVTHAHPDHIVDAPAIAKMNNIPLWGAGDLNMALNTLGVLPAAHLPRFAVGGTVTPARKKE